MSNKNISLEDVNSWLDVTDQQGASKLLTLKVVNIAKLVEARHIHNAFSHARMKAEEDLIKELIFYKDLKSTAKREYGLDYSGFDGAVKHIVPIDYWNYIQNEQDFLKYAAETINALGPGTIVSDSFVSHRGGSMVILG